ncbi:hypothetical protein NE237_018507 [Protea cynaroides]|uniref:DUF3741 domain-containing protein n=1 Tax=Protea cynaroides TaxID=273540 RepID=A0A9Q0QP30_9MAGN|nr:hypothetical protein NE237_018507 [Protea cynaroides]
MARRTDLSQKLLDDLRLRKEQMTMSHTSNYANHMQSAGGNFRKPMRGSRPVNTRETTSPSMGDQNKRLSTSYNRPRIKEGASKEIAPLRRAQNSQYIGDLSMALAFALENGGTLRQLTSSANPILGFLQHIGRSVDFMQMDRSNSLVRNRPQNSCFPTLSQFHVKEISKGAQKLNQILNACSNGLNLDRYSMDIGKELLKGAMELEESLRMLVNLQEASEYMTGPQRKQRIILLEDEDDDETAIGGNHKKQVNRSKTFFKGPNRNSPKDAQEVTKGSLVKQQLLALSYPTEAVQFSSNNHKPSSSVSHRRSVSYGPDSNTLIASSEPMKQSKTDHSKTGKGRIPNVIAKLMGIEELPPNTIPKDGAEKHKVLKPEKVSKDAKQITEVRIKKEERTLMDYRGPPSKKTQTPRPQGLQANISATPGSSLSPAADKIMVLYNGSFDFVSHEEIPHFRGPKDRENMNIISNSKPTATINNPKMNTTQLSKISGIQQDKQGKERKEVKPNPRDWKTIERRENSEAFPEALQRMVLQANKHQETADFKQDKGMEKQHKEKKNADNFNMLSNQQKAPHKSGSQQPRESESQGAKLHEDEKRTHSTKGKLQVNNPKGSGTLLTLKSMHGTTNLQKKLPRMNHAPSGQRSPKEIFEKMSPKGSRKKSHSERITTKHKFNIDSPGESSEAQADNDVKRTTTSTPQQMLSEAIHVQPRQEKSSSKDMHERVNSQKRDTKVEEVVTRKNGSTNNTGRPLKQHISVLQQLKQRKSEETHKSKEAISINMSGKAKASEPMNLVPKEKAEPSSTFNNSLGDGCQSPREISATAPHAITNNKTSVVLNSPLDLVPKLDNDKDDAAPSDSMSVQLKGSSEKGMLGICNSSQQGHQKTFGGHSLLKEENHLKQILLTSPIFLNTAKALFGLLIPIDILHFSAQTCKDDDSKLVLDCCYEVMKRKGKRKELTFYPCVSISVRSVKLKGLDDLVKELHEDLEALKFLNQDSGDESDTALYLHSMVERDIQNRNPDLNCMWDFGWSETMFAYLGKDEVIRDVEKCVLNELIDEILEDILQVSISVCYRN